MMELTLNRLPSDETCTHGDLFVDDVWQCYTLEDVVREVKIKGKTAIPAGRYRITLENSPRFGADTLTVNSVPDFIGVRIHAGNDAGDTEGCPLVGLARDGDRILQSRLALGALKQKVKRALDNGEDVWLDIVNGD
jgi:hypothetical protein